MTSAFENQLTIQEIDLDLNDTNGLWKRKLYQEPLDELFSNPFLSVSEQKPLSDTRTNSLVLNSTQDIERVLEPEWPLQPPPIPARPKNLAPLSRTPLYASKPNALQSNDTFNNGQSDVSSSLLPPVPNSKQDSTSTVVDSSSKTQLNEENDVLHHASNEFINESSSNVTTSAPVETGAFMSDTTSSNRRKWIGKWQLGKTIGEGSSGKVKLALHSETKETCVVKAVRRPKLANGSTANSQEASYASPSSLEKVYKRELYMIREACLGMMLTHPNIVKLHSAVLGENHFYCFFELVEGEDLVDYISREGPLGESKSREIFRRAISAIDYAHRNHVVHRDIKLENIRYNPKNGVVKILDFGFASFYTENEALHTNCGSPCYAAPEIYDNKPYSGPMIDVWSLGVCLYGMVTGTLPFDGPDFKTLASKVRSGKVHFPPELSQGLVILISGMFKTDPRKRMTLDEVIKDDWVNLGYKTYPVDYLEWNRDKTPTIKKDWARMITKAPICQAGCMLMEELEERIPSRQLVNDHGQAEVTDEDDSMDDAELEASKFVSNMTIKDKRTSNIWWRRLFRFPRKEDKVIEQDITKKLQHDQEREIEKYGGTIAHFVDMIRGHRTEPNPSENATPSATPALPPKPKGRFRAFTNNVVNLFTPEKTSEPFKPPRPAGRHSRWSPFKVK